MTNTALEKKFNSHILRQEAANMQAEQNKVMATAGFSSRQQWKQKNFTVTNNELVFTHRPEVRFVDMATRQTKAGKIKKVAHPVFNKILFGYANNIVHRIGFEFTEDTKQELLKDFPQQI